MNSLSTEAEILQQEVRRLEAEGYDVFIQPKPPHSPAPSFLGDFVPDAVALGHGKKIVIEVARQSDASKKKLSELAAKFRNQDEWELKLVVVSPASSGKHIPVQSQEAIKSTLEEVEKLRSHDAYRAAFLLGWAALEAQGRALMSGEFGRPQTPGRLIQVLSQAGYLTPTEGDQARELATMRNNLVHGDLALGVSDKDVRLLLTILKKISGAAVN